MKKNNLFCTFISASVLCSGVAVAEQPQMQYYKENSKRSINTFETSKDNDVEFTGLQLRLGGDFAVQFQGLTQENDGVGDTLVELGDNFNLPSANLNIDVQLAEGVRVHLVPYVWVWMKLITVTPISGDRITPILFLTPLLATTLWMP